MEEEVIKELESILNGLRKIRQDTWGQSNLYELRIDKEIKKLEELIINMDPTWNGSHPIGQT